MVTTRPSTGAKDLWLDYFPEYVHEKYPNVTVTVEQLPTDQYTSTVKMRLASGSGPDLFTWWPQMQMQPLVKAGYLYNLTSFKQIGNFNKAMVSAYTFSNKVLAIPLGMSFLTVWYNKDMFAKTGITDIPDSWDAFLEDCQKLKDAGIVPIVDGDKQSFTEQFPIYQIGASQIYVKNKNFDTQLSSGKTKFTDVLWTNTLTKFQNLYTKGYVMSGSLGLSQDQARQMFIDGKAAMTIDGSFGYSALTKTGAVTFEKGIFPLPGNDKGQKQIVNLSPGVGLCVNAKSSNISAIMEVLNYMFTKDTPLFNIWVQNNDNITDYNGTNDPRKLISDYIAKYTTNHETYGNLNNNWPSGVSDALTSGTQELVMNTTTVQKVQQSLQDKFDQLNTQ